MSPALLKSQAAQLLRAGQLCFRLGPSHYSNNGARTLMWEAQTDLYAPGVRCGCGCGRQLVSRKHFPSSGDRDTLDHVWPKAFGGPDSLGNLMLLTRNCNDRKAQARPSTEQIKLLEQINTRLGWPTPHELFI